jgi:hypothetical protein
MKYIEKYIENYSGKYAFLHPESKILLTWNFVVVGAIGFNCYEIPVALCFT